MLKKLMRAIWALVGILAFAGCSNPVSPGDSYPEPVGDIMCVRAGGDAASVWWNRATDDATAQENLLYKLVRALSLDAINTVGKANAEPGAATGVSCDMDWTADTICKNVPGLDPSTIYFFAVLVRDGDGNMSLYRPTNCNTAGDADTEPPTPGAGISVSGATITWGDGWDILTPFNFLEYKLVRAWSSGQIDTVDEANAVSGSDLLMDWTVDALSYSGSVAGCYYAVLVRDAAGNMSLYTPVCAGYAD